MLPENHPMTRMCERVVARLAPATGMEGVDWKVHVINEDIPNAFVIPGGQIFVFTVSSLVCLYYSTNLLAIFYSLLPSQSLSIYIHLSSAEPHLSLISPISIYLPIQVPLLLNPLHSSQFREFSLISRESSR